VLPDGELFEYICSACGTSVGTRKVEAQTPPVVLS
jgi:DNA-directed RNA polymerase subunit RPC12/RpoP